MTNQYYMIGNRREIEGGAIFSAGDTDNGYCYKSEKAIKERKGICYIAECGFDKEELVLTPDNTWEEIHNGSVVTYTSAADKVRALMHTCYPEFATIANFDLCMEFTYKITDYILEEVDWQCFSTMLNELDMDEELAYFLESKFVEFAKERLKKDGDDTQYEDDDDLWDKLSNYLGQYCYRHDDFSLTDWDSLIDKWEDEPNY
jgi:hypothetical protein